jgi:UDP-N-acetylglucosamine 4,6-dehydratase
VVNLALAMNESASLREVGIREGEKLHEVMITEEDSRLTYDYGNHYIIYPHAEWWHKERHFTPGGTPVKEGFRYSSDSNKQWLNRDEMRQRLKTIELVY